MHLLCILMPPKSKCPAPMGLRPLMADYLRLTHAGAMRRLRFTGFYGKDIPFRAHDDHPTPYTVKGGSVPCAVGNIRTMLQRRSNAIAIVRVVRRARWNEAHHPRS